MGDATDRPHFLDRQESAEYLNSLGRDELFERFGITRVGNITGFDCIGVPVYHATRPAALVLAQNSGKGPNARAGAIAEGIEYCVFESPQGDFWIDRLEGFQTDLLPLAKGSKWTPETRIPLELAQRLDGTSVVFPSDLLWMVHRKAKLMHFQMTSNGQAIGGSFASAFLGGLYECIERDAMTLTLYRWKGYGIAAQRVKLPNDDLVDRIAEAGLKLYLFRAMSDIQVPVYCTYLVDPGGDFFTTTGWGCNLLHYKAAEAAILEAIQSRCVYIAGARDDLLQRDYDLAKSHDPREQMRYMESLPMEAQLLPWSLEFSTRQELAMVLEQLKDWHDQIFYKTIDLGQLKAVKTIILGLEPPIHELWQPSKRSFSAVLPSMA